MSYEVLARKWRPHRFNELVGQEHVVQALSNALDNDRLHHAYLFTGTRGVGKTTLARIFAKSLNCEEGVSSTPCGVCSSCQEVDEGRFVDLLEVDAASRTKVDQTRELLENVPYAPVRGRYKVYLIDEVHMFSDSSFNALLKTLEEPPPHVKFLLATTDPQKLPMTVLSRCLQFSLKRLTLDQIGHQLKHILDTEEVPFDDAALNMLAAGADGSMRDGLSLLDQTIAFGAGEVREGQVQSMLGAVSRDYVFGLIDALVDKNGPQLLQRVQEISERAPDFRGVLDELLRILHRISVQQMVTDVSGVTPDQHLVVSLASALPAEDVQLLYQIALTGKRDMIHAPDLRSGFEMVLLRMLAFRPDTERTYNNSKKAQSVEKQPIAKPPSGQSAQSVKTQQPVQQSALSADEDWKSITERLKLGGVASQLAANCALESFNENHMILVLGASHQALNSAMASNRLQSALQQEYGEALQLEIQVGAVEAETPAQHQIRKQKERMADAKSQMLDDPFVKAAQEQFDAVVIDESVKPV